MTYFNLKPPKTERATRRTKKPPREGNSEQHLRAIRQLPCVITLRRPCGEAHHMKATGERGAGRRSSDKWAVPLSHGPHMELESKGSKNELAWFASYGIDDPLGLAAALWKASPDVQKMTAIVYAHACEDKQ